MKEYITLKGLYRLPKVVVYYKDSERQIRHRENEKPAVIWSDGTISFYENDRFYIPKNK
jgi:hypothetical protein